MRLTTAGWNERIVKDRWREVGLKNLSPQSNLAERAADFSSYFWPAVEVAEASYQVGGLAAKRCQKTRKKEG
jgi:hypothetical protein